VNCLQVYNNELYAGGQFVNMNNVSAQRIAKWNGTAWSAVDGGVTGSMASVNCMAVYHNQLYVGGNFYFAGSSSISTNCIARWNGVSWDSVGGGLNWYVTDMVVDSVNDILYVSGGFTGFGNTICRGVAMWNDTNWSPVGSGLDTLWGTQCLEMFNGELYAGGANVTVTTFGDTINNIYKYDGTKWISVDGGANNTVMDLAVFNGNLYVGGYFSGVGNGTNANKIACYGSTCPVSVGIAENADMLPFKMYPNPTGDVLYVETPDSRELTFCLKNAEGRTIFEQTFTKRLEYSTANLSRGAYFVHVFSSDLKVTHVEKLIIER
jgi:hypothetical protein